MASWLLKSEPSVYSIHHLERDGRTLWTGVRNYQARNYMMAMRVGERALFYHSNATPPGIAGLVRVSREAVADPSQFAGEYVEPRATVEKPVWWCVEVEWEKTATFVSLEELKAMKALSAMPLLQKGSRLSVQPVSATELRAVMKKAKL